MAPLRVFTNWNSRSSDEFEQIEPYKRYFLICEGENTERWYFKTLISERKALKINSTIDVRYVERTGRELHHSNPVKLIEQGVQIMWDDDSGFEEGDVIILIFDVDIYKSQGEEKLKEVLITAKEKGFWVGITNPSIELFLLLHVPNSYNNIVKPNYSEILKNKKISNKRTFIHKLLSDEIKMNPKSNEDVGLLALNIDTAIEQEKLLNQDLKFCLEKVTSNIGDIISKIKEGK